MGQPVMRRAPKYVRGFIDRHGKPRSIRNRSGTPRQRAFTLPFWDALRAPAQRFGQPAIVGKIVPRVGFSVT
jgi:hypothetical protein